MFILKFKNENCVLFLKLETINYMLILKFKNEQGVLILKLENNKFSVCF